MTQKALSIILPVFNGTSYIRESVTSVLTQAITEMELIIVDDGSTDKTVEIVRDHFQKYIQTGHIRLIVQENQGVSVARNSGIRNAAGSYLGFLDADDVLLPGYVARVMQGINDEADIIEFGYKTFVGSTAEMDDARVLYTNRIFGRHDMSRVIDHVFGISHWYPWSRVFKASLFQDVSFPRSVRFCEDLMTVPFLYEKARTILNYEVALYGYRTNPESATFNVRPDYVERLLEFYHTVPKHGFARHAYLRIAVLYSIFSCRNKAGQPHILSPEISADIKRDRYLLSLYRDIDFRRALIVLYPFFYKAAKQLKAFLGFIRRMHKPA